MTIDANTVTLADYALMSQNPLVRGISYSLIENGSVIQDIPLTTSASLIANGIRFEGNLPTVNWSKLNREGVATKGTPKQYQEQAYIVRNHIDMDKYLVRDKNAVVDPRSAQLDVYMKALSYDFNDKFINNNHITGDADAPVGIRARIDNGTLYGVRSVNKINAGGIDLREDQVTAAIGNKFIKLLDKLLWSVDSPTGSGVVLYMNDEMYRTFAFVIRMMGTQGGFSSTQDQFGRVIDRYKGALIRDIGYKADQSTPIITATEDTSGNDASSTYTSIYAVNYSVSHFFGWQFSDPDVIDHGLLENYSIYRTSIDWAIGLMNESTRSLGRLYGIRLA